MSAGNRARARRGYRPRRIGQARAVRRCARRIHHDITLTGGQRITCGYDVDRPRGHRRVTRHDQFAGLRRADRAHLQRAACLIVVTRNGDGLIDLQHGGAVIVDRVAADVDVVVQQQVARAELDIRTGIRDRADRAAKTGQRADHQRAERGVGPPGQPAPGR